MELLEFAPNLIAIFVFVLIVSGNYLGELFPCRVQQIFNSNMYVKHTLGFLTLLFFVALTIPELKEQEHFLGYTTLIYLWFIMMAKCYYTIWFLVFGLVGVLYVMQMYKDAKEKKDGEGGSQDLELLKQAERVVIVLAFVLTVVGFLVYMGAKKMEYNKNFSYLQFIFGMPSCKGKSPPFPGYLTLLKHALD
tara:strand:+ start:17 stop:592 length:576 start_codon:yes stop_codon:yes gene_type:complete